MKHAVVWGSGGMPLGILEKGRVYIINLGFVNMVDTGCTVLLDSGFRPGVI